MIDGGKLTDEDQEEEGDADIWDFYSQLYNTINVWMTLDFEVFCLFFKDFVCPLVSHFHSIVQDLRLCVNSVDLFVL